MWWNTRKRRSWRSQAKTACSAEGRRGHVNILLVVIISNVLVWWNGRRVGLKIRCWRQHVGSSPTTSTNVPRVLPEAFFVFVPRKR